MTVLADFGIELVAAQREEAVLRRALRRLVADFRLFAADFRVFRFAAFFLPARRFAVGFLLGAGTPSRTGSAAIAKRDPDACLPKTISVSVLIFVFWSISG